MLLVRGPVNAAPPFVLQDTSAVEASRVSGHDKLMGQWVQQLAAIRNDAAKSNGTSHLQNLRAK